MIQAKRDGRVVYHWPASLKELIGLRKKFGKLDDADERCGSNDYEDRLDEALVAAEDWQMCACGSLCRAIPRVQEGENPPLSVFTANYDELAPLNAPDAPKDKTLAKLGIQFMKRIQEQDFEDALETMEKIEKRATEILTKMGLVKKSYGKPLKK